MKKITIISAIALLLSGSAFAQNAPGTLSWYGFIRNYMVYDSHQSSAGTEDLFYYMPTPEPGEGTFNFVSLTSRVGFDVNGGELDGWKMGARMEADFYLKSGTTAILRLRQAYVNISKGSVSWKIGQAWHPMAADMPDIFSLEAGAPFGPFGRSPQINYIHSLSSNLSLTAAAIWQMQFTSTGPEGASANYIKYSGIPELYLGLNLTDGHFLSRLGADVLSIKPFRNNPGRLTTANFFFYGQYSDLDWNLKGKLTYASDGSHMNMVGGYGLSSISNEGRYSFSATRNMSAWVSVMYKGFGRIIPQIFLGHTLMLGTPREVTGEFFGKNNAAGVNSMYRIQPELIYRFGRLDLGLEYMYTGVRYGHADSWMHVNRNLYNVENHRLQAMVKYSF